MLLAFASRSTLGQVQPQLCRQPYDETSSVLTVPAPGASISVTHDREHDRFWLGRHLLHNHHQSLLRTTSLDLASETAPSSHRTSSPSSMLAASSRNCTSPLRMPLRSSASPSLASPSSGPPSPAARLRGIHNSSPLLLAPKASLSTPTITLRASRVARTGTPSGSVPTTLFAKPPSRRTSSRSAIVTSRLSPMTAVALRVITSPTAVRTFPGTAPLSSILLLGFPKDGPCGGAYIVDTPISLYTCM